MRALIVALCALVMASGCSDEPAPKTTLDMGADLAQTGQDMPADMPAAGVVDVRVMTFNASLFRDQPGQLVAELEQGSAQARKVAEIVQRVRPHVFLLNELDRDAEGRAVALLRDDYLHKAQGAQQALGGLEVYAPESNTGEPSGLDLNRDGKTGGAIGSQAYGDDAYGFGRFPGQYGMALISQWPIQRDKIRTFRTLRWQAMPDALLPAEWYGAEATAALRLSSKTHADVPVTLPNGRTLHLLISHPTPPSFDGDEDRNGRRNHDEIRFWVDYLSASPASDYIVDDAGVSGGLAEGELFVIMGDFNSDPLDGDSRHEAIADLLAHPRVVDPQPKSEGGALTAAADGQANTVHKGDPALDTADFSDGRVGNLRVDYVLPSIGATTSGVFWPAPGEDGAALLSASDHRPVWVDLSVQP